jgi:hypothetical protein
MMQYTLHGAAGNPQFFRDILISLPSASQDEHASFPIGQHHDTPVFILCGLTEGIMP